MKSFRIPFAFAAALVAAPLLAAPAVAQEQPQQANQPVKPTEQRQIGDWTVRCFPGNSPAACQMVQVRAVAKTKQRIMGILLAYIPQRDADLMEISVPLGVELQNGLVLNTDTYKSGALKFTRCDGAGCYVEGAIGKDILRQVGRATKSEVQILSTNGKKYNLVFSMKGFNDAHKALVELARAKAGGGAAKPEEQKTEQ